MARKKQVTPVGNVKKAKLLADQAVALADFAAKAYIAADELRIKTKAVNRFPLDGDERATVAEIPALPANLKKKLAKKDAAFTIVDVARILMAMSESFAEAGPGQQVALLMISKKLMDLVMSESAAKAKKAKSTDTVYQFKIR